MNSLRLILVSVSCCLLLVFSSCGALASTFSGEGTVPLSIPVDPAIRARVSDRYGALPLSFISNAGQTDPAVRFQVKGAGYTMFFTPNEVVFRLTERGGEGSR